MDSTPNFTEHRVSRGKGSVYAREYEGAAPAFVLMHGFPDNLHIWDDLVPHLVAAGHRVVTFDFLGFGTSDKLTDATYSFEQQLGDLQAVVQALGLGKIVPVAHDSSGPAAVNYALAYPEMVEEVVMLNSAYDEIRDVLWPELITLFATPSLRALAMEIALSPGQFGWLLEWQQKQFLDALPASQKAHFGEAIGHLVATNFTVQPSSGPAFVQLTAQFCEALAANAARSAELISLDVPVRLIWGQHDPYLTVAMGGTTADPIQTSHPEGAARRTLAAGGHAGAGRQGDAVMTRRSPAPLVGRLTRLGGIGLLAATLVSLAPPISRAQPAPMDPAFTVPTTKLLAIGSFTAKATPGVWQPIIPSEMRQTAELYLAGKIDQWFVKTDQSGVVFILNVTDSKEAHELLDKLPLGQAGQMEFQLIPLGPLSPMRTLLPKSQK